MEITVMNKTKLCGEVEISTSKNATLPIIAAALLSEEQSIIDKIPEINDVGIIYKLIAQLGAEIKAVNNQYYISGFVSRTNPEYELVRQIRASLLLMGPILATRGNVKIPLPGGCAIGNRPIDLHLKGFEAMGADIALSGGDVTASASKLKGAHIYLDYPSVGATENLIMAASLADGVTYIENAALEPEVVDMAAFINAMGGAITFCGNNVVRIDGKKKLNGTHFTPIPDRIESGTYMVAAAATAGDLLVKNVIPDHLKAITSKLTESGAEVNEMGNQIRVRRQKEVKPVYIKTMPYPGFPTDMQPQFMAYLSQSEGSSIITEAVFENRFMHVPELLRMGANIKTEGRTAVIKGTPTLSGARVRATDLRAGAALLIAGMMTDDTTIISDSQHINRGYENIIGKLNNLGAQITISE